MSFEPKLIATDRHSGEWLEHEELPDDLEALAGQLRTDATHLAQEFPAAAPGAVFCHAIHQMVEADSSAVSADRQATGWELAGRISRGMAAAVLWVSLTVAALGLWQLQGPASGSQAAVGNLAVAMPTLASYQSVDGNFSAATGGLGSLQPRLRQAYWDLVGSEGEQLSEAVRCSIQPCAYTGPPFNMPADVEGQANSVPIFSLGQDVSPQVSELQLELIRYRRLMELYESQVRMYEEELGRQREVEWRDSNHPISEFQAIRLQLDESGKEIDELKSQH